MQEKNKSENLVVQLTYDFSLSVIEYCELLESMKKFCIANQLLKSATSIGANVWEAQNAESKADFIHKFKIAAKEVDETKYWTLLCKHAKNYPDSSFLLNDLESISKVIAKIISTSKKTKSNSQLANHCCPGKIIKHFSKVYKLPIFGP